MSDLSSYLVEQMVEAETNFVGRYMCNGDFCPCAPTVNPADYGERENEFEFLDTTGRVVRFYEDCYLPVLMSDTGYNGYSMNKTAFSEEILYMIEEFEVEFNCAGVCET